MSSTGISVIIPVGPEKAHKRYLTECLESVRAQTLSAAEILIIDDMAGLPPIEGTRVWRSPWRLGVAHAFNVGVALTSNNLAFMLGADDKLLPNCLSECEDAFARGARRDAYYYVGVQYSDGRADQYLACNAAMVTKGLWRSSGGFPLESASGAPDAALVSTLMVHKEAGALVLVNGKTPLYWYRVHGESDTAKRQPWQGVIGATRNISTQLWKQPEWGRFSL